MDSYKREELRRRNSFERRQREREAREAPRKAIKDGSPIAPWAFFDLASRLSELLEDLELALPAYGN